MNQKELNKAFPYGARLIPLGREEEDGAVRARLLVDRDEENLINAWLDPFRSIGLEDNLTPENDGFRAKGYNGVEYFLRPLTKEQEPGF